MRDRWFFDYLSFPIYEETFARLKAIEVNA